MPQLFDAAGGSFVFVVLARNERQRDAESTTASQHTPIRRALWTFLSLPILAHWTARNTVPECSPWVPFAHITRASPCLKRVPWLSARRSACAPYHAECAADVIVLLSLAAHIALCLLRRARRAGRAGRTFMSLATSRCATFLHSSFARVGLLQVKRTARYWLMTQTPPLQTFQCGWCGAVTEGPRPESERKVLLPRRAAGSLGQPALPVSFRC